MQDPRDRSTDRHSSTAPLAARSRRGRGARCEEEDHVSSLLQGSSITVVDRSMPTPFSSRSVARREGLAIAEASWPRCEWSLQQFMTRETSCAGRVERAGQFCVYPARRPWLQSCSLFLLSLYGDVVQRSVNRQHSAASVQKLKLKH